LGADGSFYGVTDFGGPQNAGVVYRITSEGQFNVLYSYNGVDGAYANWRFTDYGEPGTNDLIVTLRVVAPNGGPVVLDVTTPTRLTFGNHQAHAD